MKTICKLKNQVREYDWGSRTSISNLLGSGEAQQPQAELWMGAHPDDPSSLQRPEGQVQLDEAIVKAPADILGPQVAERFGQLPFLFKLLAAERALSIQLHPDSDQAEAGFGRELASPRPAEQRSYRDPHHKPEILVALEPDRCFWVLRGFRPIPEILSHLERLVKEPLAAQIAALEASPNAHGLRDFFESLLKLAVEERRAVRAAALSRAAVTEDPTTPDFWIRRLDDQFADRQATGGDPALLAPALMNLLGLQQGEGVYTGPGVFHAYLEGFGVELMANSDNVIRGGLTRKFRDIPELLRIGNFESDVPEVLTPELVGCEWRYQTPAEEFALSRLEVAADAPCRPLVDGASGPQILLCVAGSGMVKTTDEHGGAVAFQCGDSFLIPAAVDHYLIEGEATLFRAAVGHAALFRNQECDVRASAS